MVQTTENTLSKTARSTVKRGRQRASYDRDTAYDIIDAALVAYLGIVLDDRPFVLPTSHWRDGDYLYWHAASTGRMGKALAGQQVCITLALLDGLVMARSAFHHSVNYRSVMLFGEVEYIDEPAEKQRQLEIFIERLSPERWQTLRPMQENELKATGVMRIRIDEGSVKVRHAPPADDEEDYTWPVWAGVLPMQTQFMPAEPCPRLQDTELAVPKVGSVTL